MADRARSRPGRKPGHRGTLRQLRKSLLPAWRHNQWLFIAALWLVTISLGFTGFMKHHEALNRGSSFWDIFYLTLQLFVMQSGDVTPVPWQLDIARFIAPFVAAFTAVQAAALIFHEQVQKLFLFFLSDHVVICGLGRKGELIADEFRREGHQVVIIEKNGGNSAIEHCRVEDMTVLVGDATSGEILERAGIARARYLLVLTGNDGENAEIAAQARQLSKNRKRGVLNCLIHIVNPVLCSFLREQELSSPYESRFRLEFFNVFERGARALAERYLAPRRNGDAESGQEKPPAPRFMIMGMEELGEALVAEAARRWQAARGDAAEKMLIVILDRDAVRKRESLLRRYASLEKICSLMAINGDASTGLQDSSFLLDDKGHCRVDWIFVCERDDSRALCAALALYQKVRSLDATLVIPMSGSTGLAALLAAKQPQQGAGLQVFSLYEHTCGLELIVGGTHEIIARAMHEEYLKNRGRQGLSKEDRPSLAPWDELPERVREWTRRQADHVGIKLAAVGCALAPLTDLEEAPCEFSPREIETMVTLEHDRFVRERKSEGWTEGPMDPKKKISPHLGPWEEVPPDIQELVRDTIRRMPAFLKEAGFRILRCK
jgi:hypothetical protein